MNGGRRLWGVVGLSLLAVLGKGSATARVREVEGATPVNGQVVRPDLSDDGLDGKIRVRVRIPPRLMRFLRRGDGFGGPSVNLLRQDFAAVPIGLCYRRHPGVLAILPGLPLAEGQYTLTLASWLLGRPGRLDDPPADFSTSFTVGSDIYPPVIRDTSPAPNQMETPLFAPITVTFNESLDPASVVLGKTVFVEDAGVQPPVSLEGVLLLKRGGFDLVFVPDPCFGYPPLTTVRLRILGGSHEDPVRDLNGNAMEDDLVLGFATAGDGPITDPRLVPPPAGAFYATTADTVVAFDIRDAFAGDGSVHLDRIRQVTAANGYGGDFRARLGRPGDAVVDPREDPVTGQSSLFVVDEVANKVVVIQTDNGRVGARVRGFTAPRGLGIATRRNHPETASLFVTDAGQQTLTRMSLDMPPATPTCAAEVYLEPPQRMAVTTPGTPGAVAVGSFPDSQIAMVALPALFETTAFGVGDSGDLTASFDDTSLVGSNPMALSWADVTVAGYHICWVVSEVRPPGTGGLVGIQTDNVPGFDMGNWILVSSYHGLQDPGTPCALPGTLKCLVPDRASGSLVELETVISGGFPAIGMGLVQNRWIEVGEVPSSVATDPTGRLAFVSLVGEGMVAVIDLADPAPVPFKLPLPGVRSVFSTVTQ